MYIYFCYFNNLCIFQSQGNPLPTVLMFLLPCHGFLRNKGKLLTVVWNIASVSF